MHKSESIFFPYTVWKSNTYILVQLSQQFFFGVLLWGLEEKCERISARRQVVRLRNLSILFIIILRWLQYASDFIWLKKNLEYSLYFKTRFAIILKINNLSILYNIFCNVAGLLPEGLFYQSYGQISVPFHTKSHLVCLSILPSVFLYIYFYSPHQIKMF